MQKTTGIAAAVILLTCAACNGDDVRAGRTTTESSALTSSPLSSLAHAGAFRDGVTVRLSPSFPGGTRTSFGVPIPPGIVTDASSIRVLRGDAPVAATIRETLADHGPSGARVGTRAVVIQIPAITETEELRVVWSGGDPAAGAGELEPFASEGVSAQSPSVAKTAIRTIVNQNGVYTLEESSPATVTLFTGREPRTLAEFPEGYLAMTGILGEQVSAARASRDENAGLSFFSSALRDFALSAMYEESYPLNDSPESVVDPVESYEGWLYDRCATFLTAYTHLGDARFLRHAYQTCSNYAAHINLTAPDLGYFNGKPEPDAKYSHVRGLYAYYALTGDELALQAGQAVAQMWQSDPLFAMPYEEGHVRGPDKLWTERLLATSLEGLYYGHRLTGDTAYLVSAKRLVDTAYAHITGDASALALINPGSNFPPQNCFVHNGEQQAEAGSEEPWCSPWMSELMLDALLRYQAQTGDDRVDEILVRLGRFLRDTGTAYFTNDVQDDTFLAPSVCDDPTKGDNRRRLVPLYGAAVDASGKRHNFGDYDDSLHCADASALTAAAIRALRRQGRFDENPIGPFPSEGASFVALHQELASCAERAFAEQTRPRRDPALWTSAELAAGASDPAKFIEDNRIGYPSRSQAPQRRISWWFNMSMLGFKLLDDANVSLPTLAPAGLNPPTCP